MAQFLQVAELAAKLIVKINDCNLFCYALN